MKPGLASGFLVFLLCLCACSRPGTQKQTQAGTRFAQCFSIVGDSQLWVRNDVETPQFSYRYRQNMFDARSARIVCLSSVISAMFDALGMTDAVIGVDDTAYITSPGLRKRMAAGKVKSYAPGGMVLLEQLVAAAPDVVFWYTMDQGNATLCRQLESAGIPVIMVQSFAETHPLGRSEWLRFTGRLFGLGSKADSVFREIETSYLEIASDSLRTASEPTVLVNAPFSGQWNLPAANSYLSILIRDAGGRYLWGNKKGSGTFNLQLEAVFQAAADAEVWINCNDYRSRKELLADDNRFSNIRAFRENRVFAANKGSRIGGGLPFWEEGSIRPDKVLQDLRLVFAADSARFADMHYYRALP
jgi:iron complex transport system substrate-binding protein